VVRARIESLLAELSLEEKAALCAGSGMWTTTAVERLGIPRLKLSDGPIGVRGGHLGSGTTAACFPNASALGATWNSELLQEIGVALGQEAHSKDVHVVLGPTVNLHRSPLGGRYFECYSEDPLLSARLCVAFVQGLQSQGVGACVKHFVCNDSEFERHRISSQVDERALRELYLRPFEAAVREADPWMVMAAYNRINGTWACEHRELLVGLLKGEWGFEGVVVSDWFAVHDTLGAARGGLDLEMPGPPRFFGPALAQAVKDGRVPQSELDDKVRRVLRLVLRSGARSSEDAPERAVDRPEHRHLARRAAREAAVLLRNQGDLLPLEREALRCLAVIGPNAWATAIQGGGSARVQPHYALPVLGAIRSACEGRVEVLYEPGCASHKTLPVLDTSRIRAADGGGAGLTLEYFAGLEPGGEPLLRRTAHSAEYTWLGRFDAAVDPAHFSARLSGRFAPEEGGRHHFGLCSAGKARLFVDGRLVVDNWSTQERGDSWFGTGSTERRAEVELRAGIPVELVLEYSREGAVAMGGVRLGHLPPVAEDAMERAEAAARRADVAVVVVGLWQTSRPRATTRATWSCPQARTSWWSACWRRTPTPWWW